jgi:hypothetical protein
MPSVVTKAKSVKVVRKKTEKMCQRRDFCESGRSRLVVYHSRCRRTAPFVHGMSNDATRVHSRYRAQVSEVCGGLVGTKVSTAKTTGKRCKRSSLGTTKSPNGNGSRKYLVADKNRVTTRRSTISTGSTIVLRYGSNEADPKEADEDLRGTEEL